MAYSSVFADRIRKILTPQVVFVEKEMLGGVAFMVDDKMCVGINQDKRTGVDRLMARIDPEFYYSPLKREGCREMDFAGRPMIGRHKPKQRGRGPEGVQQPRNFAKLPRAADGLCHAARQQSG